MHSTATDSEQLAENQSHGPAKATPDPAPAPAQAQAPAQAPAHSRQKPRGHPGSENIPDARRVSPAHKNYDAPGRQGITRKKRKPKRGNVSSVILAISFLVLLLLAGWLAIDRGLTSREAWQHQFEEWLYSKGPDLQTTNRTTYAAKEAESEPEKINLSAPAAEPEPEPEPEPLSLGPPETPDQLQPEAFPTPLPQSQSEPRFEPEPKAELPVEEVLPESQLLASSTAAPEPLENPNQSAQPVRLQIKFEFDSSSLSENARERLDELARSFISSDSGRILVTGYADELGDRDYNLALSRRRADAVARYLVASGVAEEYLEVQGLGIYTEASQARAEPPTLLGRDGRIVQLEIEIDQPGS